MNKFTNLINDGKLKINKYSPEILMTVGVVGTVAGTVMACKATPKAISVLNDKNDNMEIAKECLVSIDADYTNEDYKKDTTIIYTQTGVKLLKIYAPAIGVMSLSIISIVAGNRILSKRAGAIAAAYAVVDGSFKRYRKNVIDKFGEDIDQELRYSIKKEEIKSKDENGKTVKETVDVIDADSLPNCSEYARFFDDLSGFHQKDAEYNMMYLRKQQDYANEMLKARGHLFLNEVYDLLDIPRSKAGQVVGWIYNKDGKNDNGDNYVDFNLYDPNNEQKRRFINGLDRSILLDFNVDGVIFDIIERRER